MYPYVEVVGGMYVYKPICLCICVYIVIILFLKSTDWIFSCRESDDDELDENEVNALENTT